MQSFKTIFDQPFVDRRRNTYVDTMRLELDLPVCVSSSMNVQLPCMEKPRTPTSVTLIATDFDNPRIHVTLADIDVSEAADVVLQSYQLAGWAPVATFSRR